MATPTGAKATHNSSPLVRLASFMYIKMDSNGHIYWSNSQHLNNGKAHTVWKRMDSYGQSGSSSFYLHKANAIRFMVSHRPVFKF